MNFFRVIFDPAIIIIIATFVSVLIYTYKKYVYVNLNLNWLIAVLSKYKKADLSFRFGEIDATIQKNGYFVNLWSEFKNTLIFSQSIAIKNKNSGVAFQNVSQNEANIQTTVDPQYFFNEETLVTSKYNSKIINAAPTLLTGMGPLFTFLNIAIAFTHVDFSSQETSLSSVSGLMSSMQIAALCSVLAVSASLIYLLFEKVYYNKMCKAPLEQAQNLLYALFDNISSEKFLIELLKETKVQNSNLTGLLNSLPETFKKALESSVQKTVTPYLENLLFGINTMTESINKIKVINSSKNSDGGDVVDKLF